MRIVNLDHNQNLNSCSGQKSKNLAILAQEGFKVPRGHALPTETYLEFLNPIKEEISQLLKRPEASPKIARYFLETELQSGLKQELNAILDSYCSDAFFAVRSSGSACVNGSTLLEDSSKNSLAGQFESYLMVPRNNVEEALKLCWASLFNERSLKTFDADQNSTYLDGTMSVIVQEMVVGDYSAVMMTKDPLDEREVLGIESTYGPCEALVSGKVTGDLIFCDRYSGKVLEKELGSKKEKVVYSCFSKKNRENYNLEPVTIEERKKFALSEEQINDLVSTGLKIEKIFGRPQDIEVVFLKDCLYVVQARDITTL
ncbi:MAG: PEP/pyruvate-binding domain-containing protein [Nanoarchaeota archaeon]|nr:hypothetical protein [Nanoarchaeota archaeon]MBU1622475.1 hypothetical protein [Nanoarchaeota archaeon]MBU1974492.1 hypothetical protein [Nanoarchaeota archaeon]